MKSILKVRILGIDYYTMKQVSINKTIECEDLNFIDKVIPSIKINNGKYELPETIVTAKQQADEWLSNQSELLNSIIYDNKQELKCIMNWEILSIENVGLDNIKSVVLAPIAKKSKISEIEKIGIIFTALQKDNVEFTEDFINNFLHTYQEMKDVLGGISIDKKIIIVLRALGIGLMSASNAYDRILDLYKSFDTKYVSMIGDGSNGA
jgi:hypothetical protein